jgi:hypothetical protein
MSGAKSDSKPLLLPQLEQPEAVGAVIAVRATTRHVRWIVTRSFCRFFFAIPPRLWATPGPDSAARMTRYKGVPLIGADLNELPTGDERGQVR